jgi:hypothetical protein
MGRSRSRPPGGKPRGKWSAEIRERFLALLRETGNAAAALRIVGHPNMFRKRRRRDPEFAADWAAAVAAADARLGKATGRFPGEMGTVTSNCPQALLRPGPKKVPKERGLVIRRTRGGRTQIALARECEMTGEQEAEFLARLRATGNFSGSARAVGFQPASLFDRYRKWPAFARDCDAAIEEAEIELDFALVAHAHRLLREPGETAEDDGMEGMGTVTSNCPREEGMGTPACAGAGTSNCPREAMRILAFIDRRRGGRTGRGRRKGPPERSFDEAVASVLAKIAAIERHEKRKRGEADAAPSPLMGEGGGGGGLSAGTERVSQAHPTPTPPHQGEGD